MHTSPPPLLIATGNPHKVEEIDAVLRGLGIPCEGLGGLAASVPEPEEDGATFEANALIKAVAYARATGRVCLADDSGLEIDALDGRPGVHSARYAVAADASRAERDRANNAKVLAELEGVPREQRTARFVCALCVAGPDGTCLGGVRGTFEGRIGIPAEEGVPRGANGFGYDPLFLVAPEFIKTSAELAPEAKNAISHRGRALALLVERIASGEVRIRSDS